MIMIFIRLVTSLNNIFFPQVRGQPCVNQECHVTFSFQNPLTTALTDCFFTFEGPGLQRPRQVCQTIYYSLFNRYSPLFQHSTLSATLQLNLQYIDSQIRYRDVKPGEFVTYSDKFLPRRNGERKIVASFSSRQLDEINGSTTVNVRG